MGSFISIHRVERLKFRLGGPLTDQGWPRTEDSAKRRELLKEVRAEFDRLDSLRQQLYRLGHRPEDGEAQTAYWDRLGHDGVLPWDLAHALNLLVHYRDRIVAMPSGPSARSLKNIRRDLARTIPRFSQEIALLPRR
ncbi:hypothetical protein [Salininema proteolyticum]|uniref:Uncharacterized protein n=1 Tax=Salininema proteolyticum TaxID=1607685 RepID=A0ABV8TUN9_9ACTN